MSIACDKANVALTTLHLKSKKEWISLKEIYEEVGLQNSDDKKIIKDIHDAIEKRTLVSDKFSEKQEELFVSKEKFSGLYKSIYYEQLKFISNISIGDVFTREQLMNIFKISGQSGMMKTNTLNCLVLTTSVDNGVYDDSVVENGTIIYTGEGLVGDQTITKNNKTLFESNKNDLPVYLFTKDNKRRYIFEGRVELYDTPYQIEEKDSNGNNRLVWKFPLKVIYSDNYDYSNDEKFEKIVYEIEELENKIESNENDEELIFKDGPLNIRKYRKTNKKLKRSSKPDYIAEEIIKNKQGIINEKVVYQNELKKLMAEEAEEQVKKMEEFFNNKKENEGFDILSFELDEKGNYVDKYIEVKSTKGGEATPIDITADEIEFAKNHVDNYYLYRVMYSDSKERYVKVVTGRELLSNFNFIPTTYKIYLG